MNTVTTGAYLLRSDEQQQVASPFLKILATCWGEPEQAPVQSRNGTYVAFTKIYQTKTDCPTLLVNGTYVVFAKIY